MERRRVTIPLAQGVDRGTEPQLTDGSMITAKNAVITRQGAISKRRGMEAVTANAYATEPVLTTVDGVPVMIGDECRARISDTAAAGVAGDEMRLPEMGLQQKAGLLGMWPEHFIAGNGDHANFVDVGGDAARGFYVVAMSYDTTTIIYQIDAETGVVLDQREVSLGRCCRILTTDDAVWFLYLDQSSPALRGGKVTLASGVDAAGLLWNSTIPAAGEFQMDVCHVAGDVAIIAFRENAAATNVQLLTLDASGGSITNNRLHAFPTSGTETVRALCLIKRTDTEAICVATIYDTSVPQMWVEAACFNTAMGAAIFTLNAIGLDTTFVRPYDITGIAKTSTDIRVYYTVGRLRNPANPDYEWQRRHIKAFDITNTGSWAASVPAVKLHHCALASKPWVDPLSGSTIALKITHLPATGSSPTGAVGVQYTGAVTRTQPGSTFVVRDLGTTGMVCIGKLAVDRTLVCISDQSSGTVRDWEYWADATVDYDGRLPHVIVESAGLLTTVVPVLGSYDIHRGKARYNIVGHPTKLWIDRITAARGAGAYVARLDYNVSGVRAIEARNTALIPNSCPYQSDGNGVTEQGFLWYPEDFKVMPAGSGPFTGTYSFAVVAHVEDAKGNTHWSAPVFTNQITPTVGVSRFDFTIGCLTLTRWTTVEFYIYRTKNAGNVYYLCAQIGNNVGAETVSTSSDTLDGALQGSGLYTDGGVLEDVQPPPYRVHGFHQGRQFVVPWEFEDWLAQYSKGQREKTGIGHNEIFQLQVDPEGGRITAIESLGDRVILFKAGRIFASDGYGLNDAGQGGGYARPVLISPSLGCTDEMSIARVPAGLLFLSEAGIQLLDHSLQAHPVGERVKWYTDSFTLAAVTPLPEYDSVLFIFSEVGSEALVYHYKHDQWTTWFNCAGSDAVTIDDVPWIKSLETAQTGKIVRQCASSYLDWASIFTSLIVETGWISFGDHLGHKRLKQMLIDGYNAGAHKLRIKIAYDLDPVWVDDMVLDAEGLAYFFDHTAHYGAGLDADFSGQSHQLRFRGSRAKYESIRLQISDEEESDLIALWRMDEASATADAADVTGSHDATPSPVNPEVLAGRFTNGREFDLGT